MILGDTVTPNCRSFEKQVNEISPPTSTRHICKNKWWKSSPMIQAINQIEKLVTTQLAAPERGDWIKVALCPRQWRFNLLFLFESGITECCCSVDGSDSSIGGRSINMQRLGGEELADSWCNVRVTAVHKNAHSYLTWFIFGVKNTERWTMCFIFQCSGGSNGSPMTREQWRSESSTFDASSWTEELGTHAFYNGGCL